MGAVKLRTFNFGTIRVQLAKFRRECVEAITLTGNFAGCSVRAFWPERPGVPPAASHGEPNLE